MSLYISSLNSGSNGNCYYVGNKRDAILVDAGISCRETENRMGRLGLHFGKIRAIFISHEHSDHIRGVEVISRKYRLPVYITANTLAKSRLILDSHLVRPFSANVPIHIGGLIVNAFTKRHDAADPHSFTISDQGITVGVLTDIGSVGENIVRNFTHCNAAFLEANYDEKMLEEGHYPLFLKRRIRGNDGHLSNYQALELFNNHKPPFMSHLVLSHLSEHNNSPKLVQDLFNRHAQGTHIAVASRYLESEVFCISGVNNKEFGSEGI
jgi:phosphoribosyl 1,2-cyclic phosphodiesterase